VPLEFLDSVDVLKVEKHMLSLLGYPGASLVHMRHELAIYIYIWMLHIYIEHMSLANITLFRSITMLCRTDNISQNIS
jgi:hypothetical protein